MEEKTNYNVIKEIEEIDSKLLNLWSEKDILETKKAELIVNNPEKVIEKDYGTLVKIMVKFKHLLGNYSSSIKLEEAINSMFIELETARNEIKTYEKEPEKPTYLLNLSNSIESLRNHVKRNVNNNICYIMDLEKATEIKEDYDLVKKVKFIDFFRI